MSDSEKPGPDRAKLERVNAAMTRLRRPAPGYSLMRPFGDGAPPRQYTGPARSLRALFARRDTDR